MLLIPPPLKILQIIYQSSNKRRRERRFWANRPCPFSFSQNLTSRAAAAPALGVPFYYFNKPHFQDNARLRTISNFPLALSKSHSILSLSLALLSRGGYCVLRALGAPERREVRTWRQNMQFPANQRGSPDSREILISARVVCCVCPVCVCVFVLDGGRTKQQLKSKRARAPRNKSTLIPSEHTSQFMKVKTKSWCA